MSSAKRKRQRGGHPAKVAERRQRDRRRRERPADPLRRAARTLAAEAGQLPTAVDAELWASELLGSWWPPEPFADESTDLALGAPLVQEIARIGDSGAVAALRAIGELAETELGPIALHHAEVIEATGVARPPWADAIQEAEILGTAIVREDVFDDGITVLIEARHVDAETHAVGIYIDHNLGGMAKDLLMAESISAVEKSVANRSDDEAAIRIERIAAAEASTRVHDAMDLTDMTLDPPVGEDYAPLRALARLRADELPGPPAEIETPELARHERDALRDDFLSSLEGARFAADSDEAFVASLAIDYCCDYVDGRPLRWSPIVVELFMTDWLPRKVVADRATFEAVPGALDAWVRYAGRRRDIPGWAIEKTSAAITDWTSEMLERLSISSNRGPQRAARYGQAVSGHPDPAERFALALPPLDARARERAAKQGWEAPLLDPGDPDERSMLIRLAHPGLDEAISQGRHEVMIGGQPMNPQLHLTMHEIVAAQIIDGEPPEALATAQRLLGLGRDHHEVLHMLGSIVAAQIWTVTQEQRAYSHEDHVRALAELPGSWDAQASRSR